MKKLALTVISFLFLANVLFAQPNEDQLIDEIVSQVDTEELRLIIEQLSGESPLDDGSSIFTRQVGTDGKEKAAEYIAEQYSNIGNLRVRKEGFNPVPINGLVSFLFNLLIIPQLEPEKAEEMKARYEEVLTLSIKYRWEKWENIFAVLKGESTERVLTLAHYDSIVRRELGDPLFSNAHQPINEDHLAPGADDNATGVAATILAARILSQYRFKDSIYFLNTDAEELQSGGTLAYLLKHLMSIGKIKSVINVDMIGNDHDNDGIMNIHYGEADIENPLIDIISNEHKRLSFNIDPVFLSMAYCTNEGECPLSDHQFVYRLGIKRVISFQTDLNEINLAYHTEEDTVHNINFDYMTEIVKLYVASLAREAGILGRR